jgi:hypothetical protein
MKKERLQIEKYKRIPVLYKYVMRNYQYTVRET